MATNGQLLIPEPDGPFAVGYSTIKLIDETRVDPYDAAQGKRNVMISLFYPIERSACKQISSEPYMPPMTTAFMDAGLAQFGIPKMFGTIRLQVCTEASPEALKDVTQAPLVLFSPGLTFSRHQYNAVAQKLASVGYAVVSMDYAFETIIVEHRDGTHTAGKPLTHWDPEKREQHEELLATRVEDARFVLTQLGKLDVVKTLMPEATSAFNTEKAAIFGHSFGGTTAISALMKDSRFVGAINIDGSQYGPLSDTTQPVLLFGRGEPNPRNRRIKPDWQLLWEHLKGWRQEISLNESEHITFADTALLVGLRGQEKSAVVKKMVGTLEGKRAFEVVTMYVQAFMDKVLKGEESELLKGQSEKFPEIVFG